jgi:hypothetical protein
MRGPVLAQDTANTTLRNLQFAADEVDASATTRGAQKFPRAASERISLSNVKSDTARRSRSLSFWSRFSSLKFFELLCTHFTVRLLPATIGLFSHTDLYDGVNPRHPLPHQNFNLP